MKTYPAALVLLCALLLASSPDAYGQKKDERQKLAQTGMKFLSISTDPRAAALGGAVTSLEGASVSLFQNPASMSRLEGFASLNLAQMQWLVDIKYNQASIAFAPSGGRYGVFGFSFMAVDYGDLQQTIRADNDQGFTDLDSFSPSAMSFGVGYARALTDRFSIGGHVKYVVQDLGDSVDEASGGGLTTTSNRLSVPAYDFGVLYRTGFRSLNFAVTARNFASEIEYEEESFQLPLTMRIGVSMDLMDLTSSTSTMHAFIVSMDAEHPRDYPEQIKLGGEYVFMNTVALRAGYAFPTDELGVSLGLGVHQQLAGLTLGADYAYTDAGVFNQFTRVHRLALQLSF